MKWTVRITFDVYHGRNRKFSLKRWIPFLKWNERINKRRAHQCFRKTRYKNETEARNSEWFKKNKKPFDVYLCNICDGWHITTHV